MMKSRKIWVRVDKSKNTYQISPYEYERINKITESYKIDHNNTPALIDNDAAKFVSKLQIKDRLGKKKCAYISFKDHKQNFQDRKQGRLINPTKTKLNLSI